MLGALGYPQFKKSDQLSGDQEFCRKARSKGFRVIADRTIVAEKIGNFAYGVAQPTLPPRLQTVEAPTVTPLSSVPLRTVQRMIVT